MVCHDSAMFWHIRHMKEADLLHCTYSESPLRFFATEVGRLVRRVCIRTWAVAGVDQDGIRQFYKCGTSVGANVREAMVAETLRDRIHKLKIAEKELCEMFYWLGILSGDAAVFTENETTEIADIGRQLRALLIATIVTHRKRLGK